jgi:hypothetical protein
LQAEPGDAQFPDFVHPPFEISCRGVRDRVVVLIAIVAIEVALFRDVEMGDPGLVIEHPRDRLDGKHERRGNFYGVVALNTSMALLFWGADAAAFFVDDHTMRSAFIDSF